MTTLTPDLTGTLLGYARVSTTHQTLAAQQDALTAVGVPVDRIYVDKASGTRSDRQGLRSLLDYARSGDTIVVVGIDRLGRNAAEVMTTIRDLMERDIVIRSLREGVDTATAAGRMLAGVLASLAELELELGRERRAASRKAREDRGLPTGRPRALPREKVQTLRRLHGQGEPVSVLTEMFGVSRATVYRLLGD